MASFEALERARDAVRDRGVVREQPGLFFLGLHFLYSMSSATLVGVGRDAEHLARAIAARASAASPREAALASKDAIPAPAGP